MFLQINNTTLIHINRTEWLRLSDIWWSCCWQIDFSHIFCRHGNYITWFVTFAHLSRLPSLFVALLAFYGCRGFWHYYLGCRICHILNYHWYKKNLRLKCRLLVIKSQHPRFEKIYVSNALNGNFENEIKLFSNDIASNASQIQLTNRVFHNHTRMALLTYMA